MREAVERTRSAQLPPGRDLEIDKLGATSIAKKSFPDPHVDFGFRKCFREIVH